MHMLSKRDFSPEELGTLRRSRTPTANEEVQTNEEAQVDVHDVDMISSWLCNYSKIRLQFYRMENSANNTDIPMSGSAVKNHG